MRTLNIIRWPTTLIPWHFYAIIGIAIGISLWPLLVSISIFVVAINWLLTSRWPAVGEILWQRKSVLVLVSIFLIHAVGLIHTSDFHFAFRDMRIKLPLLLLPLVLGTSAALTPRQFRIVLWAFVVGVVVSSLYSTGIYLGFWEGEDGYHELRDISPLISHIRLALLVVLAMFILIYQLVFQHNKFHSIEKKTAPVFMIWLFLFLFILKSLTGLVVFGLGLYVLFLFLITKTKRKSLKYWTLMAMVLLPLLVVSYTGWQIKAFYDTETLDYEKLPDTTALGNPYTHYIGSEQLENGHYVWYYLCNTEMKAAWEKRSALSFSGYDKTGQELRTTLIRYLASKNLRRDASGVQQLSENDVEAIENGTANYRYADGYGINDWIYEIIWQIDFYRQVGNPAGHSVTQRIEYLRVAWLIIQENFWIGTGTGDVQQAFEQKYRELDDTLPEEYQHRAHNQLVTFWLTFGIFGVIWIVFAMIYPLFAEHRQNDFLAIIFITIALASMLNEDTLETQIGTTFFAYFYSFFLYVRHNRWLPQYNQNQFLVIKKWNSRKHKSE